MEEPMTVFGALKGDIFAMLSGIPGECFQYSYDHFKLAPGLPAIDDGVAAQLRKLCGLGNAFAALEQFTDAQITASSLFMTAFSDSLDVVLDEYRGDLLDLAEEIGESARKPLSSLIYELNKYFTLLPMLAATVDEVTTRKLQGCALLAYLHEQVASKPLVSRAPYLAIYHQCHRVFLQQLASWVLHGVIIGGSDEFIIKRIAKEKREKTSYRGVWDDYEVNVAQMLPMLSKRLHVMVLELGLYCLLLKRSSQRTGAVYLSVQEEQAEEDRILALANDELLDPARLEKQLSYVYSIFTKFVGALLTDQADLFNVLQLLRDFMLLGAGNVYVAFLDDSLAELLHHITTRTSARLRASFKLALAAVGLERSGAGSMFRLNIDHEESGIAKKAVDSVSMSLMHVPWPLHVVFTQSVMTRYQRIFKFLIKLRVAQHALGIVWRKQMNVKKTTKTRECIHIWSLRAKMAFVIDSLHAYLQSDVLSVSFEELLVSLEGLSSLPKILETHEAFLDSVTSQTFQDREKIKKELEHLVGLCLRFCDLVGSYPSPEHVPSAAVIALEAEFLQLMSFLVAVLTTVKDRHLQQLLIRVDYNNYFSLGRGLPARVGAKGSSSSSSSALHPKTSLSGKYGAGDQGRPTGLESKRAAPQKTNSASAHELFSRRQAHAPTTDRTDAVDKDDRHLIDLASTSSPSQPLPTNRSVHFTTPPSS